MSIILRVDGLLGNMAGTVYGGQVICKRVVCLCAGDIRWFAGYIKVRPRMPPSLHIHQLKPTDALFEDINVLLIAVASLATAATLRVDGKAVFGAGDYVTIEGEVVEGICCAQPQGLPILLQCRLKGPQVEPQLPRIGLPEI
jgi:hypothetical protein